MNNTHDALMMQKTIEIFMEPGKVFEIRALDVKVNYGRVENWSGFFQYTGDNSNQITNEILKLKPAKGIYFTINPIDESLLALGYNRLAPSRRDGSTGDRDILRRKWLPIDIDPVRKSGTSATDQAVQLAKYKAIDVVNYLKNERFADPVIAFSGNGYHLLYPIDEPREDNGLIQRFLQNLASHFDDDKVKIDTAVHNPSRIMRFYGSVARKGDEVPALGIHHRVARILSVPN